MLRQLLLIFSVVVLFSVFLAQNIEDNHPWYGPNCTTHQCDPNGTLEACTKKHGAHRVLFFPTGGYCNCSVCMKTLSKGEDCTSLTIMDSAAYVLCDTNLTCSFNSRTCRSAMISLLSISPTFEGEIREMLNWLTK